jgi:hypothetical protein
MAFPFSVGEPVIQGTLDWVAQPPPAEGRDTHAVGFDLSNPDTVNSLEYSGLMFFRPEGVGVGPLFSRPGLEGFGSLLVRERVCQTLLDPNTAVPAADLVRVFIGFRQQQSGPADLVGRLTFMDRDPITSLPSLRTASTLEIASTNMHRGGTAGNIFMDSWFLNMRKTTVLLSSPFD